ncbi:hypothetical protein [Bacillus sp. SLBN-3]
MDDNGRANLSQNPHVIPVITKEEIDQDRKDKLDRKRYEMTILQAEITELERGAQYE